MNNLIKSNILIIDDNTKNIQLAANVLKSSEKYNIFFATSGDKGLEQLEKKNFELILLDINMPGRNGYETAKIIKSTPHIQNIPIIFLSANADQESINKGFAFGAEDYISKPFNEKELISRVNTHVELFLHKKQLENKAEQSAHLLEQYKNIIDYADMVSKTNLAGTITYCNDNFCKVSGYSKEELVGRSHNIVRHPDVCKSLYKEMWTTIKNKKVWKGEFKNRAKDGSTYHVRAVIMPILDSRGNIIEYISVRSNITEEVEAKQNIIDTQKEILITLGELGEMRSKETGQHVNRVALYSELMAKEYGLESKDVELLKMASPMHDIGKVGIPDDILLKNGPLDKKEFQIIQSHASIGHKVFATSNSEILQAAALISYEHHEKWDGTGYPRGLKEEEISIFGRITAIADVFDALSNDRVYKKAWSNEKTIEFIKDRRGTAFDPVLVDIFLDNVDEIIAIKNKHKDCVS